MYNLTFEVKEEYKEIVKDLLLYRSREIDNEDMKLKIEELEIGAQIGAQEYEERVQTSSKGKDNGYVMEAKKRLENKIKYNEIKNKRIDNALKRLEEQEAKIIREIYINKLSISKAASSLSINRKKVGLIARNSISKIKFN